MYAKFWFVTTMVICFSFVLTLAFVGPVRAAEPYVGDGPDNALTADNTWQIVEAGKPQWFAVCFDQHKSPKSTLVQMWAKPTATGAFLVLTPANVDNWKKTGGKIESIGAGTPNEFLKSQLSWEGIFDSTGKYYVMVRHSGYPGGVANSKLDPANFKLLITGGALVPCN